MTQEAAITDMQRLIRVAEKRADAASDSSEDSDAKQCIECLKLLEDKHVTAELLQETGFGPRIRQLRKHSNKHIASAAKDVVAQWRQLIAQQMSKSKKADKEPGNNKEAPVKPGDGEKAQPSVAVAEPKAPTLVNSVPAHPVKKVVERPSKPGCRSYTQPPPLPEAMRNKILQSMADALITAVDEDDEGVEPYLIAAAVEREVHSGKTETEYKSRMRTILFNLKDKKNPELRRRVLLGEIDPAALAVMSSEEMASDQKQEEIKKIRAHMQKDTTRSNNESGNITDMFKCGKCKKRRTTYYQMQTRSADEPMTTFVKNEEQREQDVPFALTAIINLAQSYEYGFLQRAMKN